MPEEEIIKPEATLTSAPVVPSKEARPAGQRKPRRPRFNDHHRQKPVVRQVRVLKDERKASDAQHDNKIGGLKIVHFGGLGEVGRNMSAIQYDDEIILIDAGVR